MSLPSLPPPPLTLDNVSNKVATVKNFLDAVLKFIKFYFKFSTTPKYMTYI
jgi:hypothetical protein